MIDFANGEYLAANIPGATLVPLDSANHILLEEEEGWTQFVAATRAFLRG